jgi:hypothetical protein
MLPLAIALIERIELADDRRLMTVGVAVFAVAAAVTDVAAAYGYGQEDIRGTMRWLLNGMVPLLPGLVAADAPRPDLVRLILDRPVPGMRRLLASPRLGIVSPRELSARAGSGTRLVRTTGAGTGPFELRGAAGPSVVLARNTGWWGTPRGLGPALDQVALRVAPSSFERLRLLHRGDVEAAWALPNGLAAGLRGDPLLTRVPGPGGRWTGLERSVRGIGSARTPPPLSSVWLTRIGAGS